MIEKADVVIIGSGIFGLHTARLFARSKKKVIVIERDPIPFARASLINQARLHHGYHYPRSLSTGLEAKKYFSRFCDEFNFAIFKDFQQIYAISKVDSLIDARSFEQFCEAVNIPLKPIDDKEYFRAGRVKKAYRANEYIFDAAKIGNAMLSELKSFPEFRLMAGTEINTVTQDSVKYKLSLSSGEEIVTGQVINASYSGVNQVHAKFGIKPLAVKYELAEVLLGNITPLYEKVGITIIDGPHFSCMPWGSGSFHSLSAVEFTPRLTSLDDLPHFSCMSNRLDCTPEKLQNCNTCNFQPSSSIQKMLELTNYYMNENFQFKFKERSLAVKVILKSAEADDSRPTLVNQVNSNPNFTTVLAGKVNTIYELDKLSRI